MTLSESHETENKVVRTSMPAVRHGLASPDSKVVDVFASEPEFREIEAALGFSEFVAHPGRTVIEPAPAGLPTIAARIVSDSAGEALDLCRVEGSDHPIILLSSEADFGFRLAAARAGVKAILKRPVDPIELLRCLEDFDNAVVRERLRVVFVDDDRFAADLNAEILRAAGIEVEVVTDPTRAIATIERLRPDLILMDLRMPEVDGVELAQVIRLSRDLVSIPIVFLSVERDETRQSIARLHGGDDFIQKPIDPARLIAQVKLRANRAKTLRAIIERDGLTGLLDHSRFRDRLDYDLSRRGRDGEELCLVAIDVDWFKAVNDTYGHCVGDQVLRTLAQVLTSSLRRSDVIGRCGGEEFGIVLRDIDERSASRLINGIRERFGALTFYAGSTRPFHVTFSAGLASSRDHLEVSALLAAADRALYTAKASGRNTVRASLPVMERLGT